MHAWRVVLYWGGKVEEGSSFRKVLDRGVISTRRDICMDSRGIDE